ncbi:MAG: hypothetical protein SXA11_11635 [Cyanobacteriota bacterium]|nr:hypothetical protein [Cyanobacteriota bacterium]
MIVLPLMLGCAIAPPNLRSGAGVGIGKSCPVSCLELLKNPVSYLKETGFVSDREIVAAVWGEAYGFSFNRKQARRLFYGGNRKQETGNRKEETGETPILRGKQETGNRRDACSTHRHL